MPLVRYIIRHHPGLMTEILIEQPPLAPVQIEDRYSLAVSREYCRQGVISRGIEPVIERPEPNTEVFPWVEIEAPAANPVSRKIGRWDV